MEQISFSDADYAAKKKVTRREKLLMEMEQIVPWAVLLRVVEPLYPVAGRGRRPYACTSMLRIHLMQHWFTLSDPGMEDALYEIESMRRFAGIELHSVPDYFTLQSFRVLAERRVNAKGQSIAMSEATVKLDVAGQRAMEVGEGNGPVNALDAALRKALIPVYPELEDIVNRLVSNEH